LDKYKVTAFTYPPFTGIWVIWFEPATYDDIHKIIAKSSKSSKSTCAHPFPTKLLCDEYLQTLLPTITCIVNQSLESDVVPTAFKLAIVRPLLKKPSINADILKNYRSVSNLPFLSKVFERIVSARLQQHMTLNNLHEEFNHHTSPVTVP
jgi:hypothetical protein